MTLIPLYGCEWNPPHDNIYDPNHPNYKPNGSLIIRVITLDLPPQPIIGATVLLPDHERIGRTDSSGEVTINDIPEGIWWVYACRDSIPETVYARDSLEVEIFQTEITVEDLALDALPVFLKTTVISEKRMLFEGGGDITELVAILTAEVTDPDGDTDLDKIEWEILDLHNNTLLYRADSSYWFAEIPSVIFPGGDLASTLSLPFTFEAFDNRGNSSKSTAHLARVIDIMPTDLYSSSSLNPRLDWIFFWRDIFNNDSSFVYLVRIYEDTDLIYERYLTQAEKRNNFGHTVEDTLVELQQYSWEVWVIDHFGNRSRSMRDVFEASR